MGIEYHTGYAKTGVIGVIKNGTSNRSIGLRGDIDALAIAEENDLDYKSKMMGHARLWSWWTYHHVIGNGEYLNETKNFDGTVYLYPTRRRRARWGRVMLEDGAFDNFKPDAMYAIHNWPEIPTGHVGYYTGAITATATDLKSTGHGLSCRWSLQGRWPRCDLCPFDYCLAIVSRNADPMAIPLSSYYECGFRR